uniref:Transmembrane protein n=1 Tax=Steinernema glaseri TaxID=37863 RepID=A0A1I7Y9P8_9BILA
MARAKRAPERVSAGDAYKALDASLQHSFEASAMGSARPLLTVLLCFLVLPSVVDACFALGGCGFGGCLAGCGRYCTAKAKGAKTLSASMTIPSETPNAVDELPDEEPHLVAKKI